MLPSLLNRDVWERENRAADPGDRSANDGGGLELFVADGRLGCREGVRVDFNKSSTLGASGGAGVRGVGGADKELLPLLP